MIRDQLREAYREQRHVWGQEHPYGSTFVTEYIEEPPDELAIQDPEFITLPLHVDVECVAYTLSLTKSTDDRIVYERDK